MTSLDFEQGLIQLESKIAELRRLSSSGGDEVDLSAEIDKLESKRERQLADLYKQLNGAQKVQVARHPERPHYSDYLAALITDFVELAGDRLFAEDQALYGGLGRFNGRAVVVIGQEKGHNTASRIAHNFGMARPEGYRKAVRLMRLAERFGLPVLSFIDTAGAYPGVGAEQRGQAEAIAKAVETCLDIKVPLIAVIIGEGGSGGAIAIAAANQVLMLEHAIYSVISPEGAASILWKDASHAKEAVEALKTTAQDLKALGAIDDIVAEPVGGAHRHHEQTFAATRQAITVALEQLVNQDGATLREARRRKFLDIGSQL